MSTKHDDLCRTIRLYLSQLDILSIDTPTPGLLFTKNGTPVRSTGKGKLDIHACAPLRFYDINGSPIRVFNKRGQEIIEVGQFIAIDAKIGRDKFKTDQASYAKAVKRHGGLAFAAYHIQDVYDELLKAGIIDETIPRPDR